MLRWRNIQGPNHHYPGELMITVNVLMQRDIDHDLTLILGGVHKVHNTDSVPVGDSDVLSESFRTSAGDADDVAAADLRFDSSNAFPRDVIDGSGSHRFFH